MKFWKININGLVFVVVALSLIILAFMMIQTLGDVDQGAYIVKDDRALIELNEKEQYVILDKGWFYYDEQLASQVGGKMVDLPHVSDGDYASYGLKLSGLEAGGEYAFYIYDTNTAFEVYVNDQLICKSGQVGEEKISERPSWQPVLLDYKAETKNIDLIIKVSSHHYKPGGLTKPIRFGNKEAIHKIRENKVITQMTIFGAIAMIGLFNGCLFLLNTKEKASLYLSMFALTVALGIPLTGERIVYNFFNLDWLVHVKIQLILGFTILVFLLGFMTVSFKNIVPKFYHLFIEVFTLVLILVVVFLPPTTYGTFDLIYGLLALASFVLIVIKLIKAAYFNVSGSFYSLLGVLFLIAGIVLDFTLAPGSLAIQMGIGVFLIFQSFVVAEKYSFIEERNKELHHVAVRDQMTGMYKRSHFKILVESIIKEEHMLINHGLLFIDIDNFKSVNDNFGHDEGDIFLQNFSQDILKLLRASDIACRFGGDEFIVWLSDTSKTEAHVIAERILQDFNEKLLDKFKAYQVGISVGVSMYPEEADNLEALITLSDKKMYVAKEKGKGQIYQ